MGVIFPPAQMGFPPMGPPPRANAPNPNTLQAGFTAFRQNRPRFHGNRWGSSHGNQGGSGSGQGTFERVSGELPVDKFPYGTADADWEQWVRRFEKAVKVATNAATPERLEELCLLWIPLKLNDEAQSIYEKCANKERDWQSLKAELAEALEDPMIRRKWARYPDAYKKPASMSLQVYRANIIGLVNKYSSALATDPTAYNIELYNRFVNGLAVDYREYIEESIPYSKETLDNAYSQALKHEAKLAKKSVEFSGATAAAMTDAEKDGMEKMRLDLEKVKTQLSAQKRESSTEGRNRGWRSRDSSAEGRNRGWRSRDQRRGSRDDRRGNSPYPSKGRESRPSSGSGRSASSGNGSRSGSGNFRKNDFRAIQTADEDSDTEFNNKFVESAAAAFSQALTSSMKRLSVRPKGPRKGTRSKKV